MYWHSLATETQDYLRLRQGSLEIEMVDEGIARFTKDIQEGGPLNMLTNDVIKRAWVELVQALYVEKYSILMGNRRRGRPVDWHQRLLDMPSQRLALLALCVGFGHTNYVTNGSANSWAYVCAGMADAIDHDLTTQSIAAANVRKYGKNIVNFNQYTPRQIKQIAQKSGALIGAGLSSKGRRQLGSHLLTMVCGTGLFQVSGRPNRGKSPTMTFVMSPELDEFLSKRLDNSAILFPKYRPMVMPPLDWGPGIRGGYMTTINPLIRASRVKSVGEPDPTTLEAVNFLQSVPFRINSPALVAAERIWEQRREGAGLPCSEPEPLPALVEQFTSDEHRDEVMEMRRLIHERNARSTGKRVSAIATLNEAKRYRQEGALWFPHTCDFRSRIYSAPSPVHTQGSDYSRGMLEFADGFPLGGRGLYWLKVQLANNFGVDKVSFDDRVAWSDSLMSDLSGREFDPHVWKEWEEADKPFQALSTAVDLWRAVQLDNPESYVSRLPVSVDGSCNGLQHLSAMGRDRVAGAEVNLIDREVPGDIYTLVLKAVSGAIDQEAEENPLAALWRGNVIRKTVKRGVMTTPYGVKPQGIRDQLIADGFTKDLGGSEFKLAQYMAGKIQDAINDVFKPGKEIMTWLQNASTQILRSTGEPVQWETPLGFGAVQHYVKNQVQRVRCCLPGSGNSSLAFYDHDGSKLDTIKSRNGIAPNFVHSLDAAHLMATVLSLKDQGLEHFLGIHDSFAVHACHVDILQRTIREEFVRVHGGDPLVAFKEYNEARMGETLPDLPERGDLELGEVLNSTYLFS